MNERDKLLDDLMEKFNEAKKELGFKSSFEDINGIFHISDYVLGANFVSERFSRQMCARIVDTYMSWLNYFQGLIFPNTGSVVSLSENKILNESDKKELSKIINEIMELVTRNSIIGLTKNKNEEAKFIDDSVNYWNGFFRAKVIDIMQKIHDGWKK